MKNVIDCTLESLNTSSELAWIITIRYENLLTAIVSLTSLFFQRIAKVHFKDTSSANSLIFKTTNKNTNASRFSIDVGSHVFLINDVWFEVVLCKFIDLLQNGWDLTAHIDLELEAEGKTIDFCFAVSPPLF